MTFESPDAMPRNNAKRSSQKRKRAVNNYIFRKIRIGKESFVDKIICTSSAFPDFESAGKKRGEITEVLGNVCAARPLITRGRSS